MGTIIPGQRFEPLDGQLVTLLVATHLLHPELRARLRYCILLAAFMSVPEATVYEDGGAILRQHDVGRTVEGAGIEAVAVAGIMEGPAHL